MRKVVLALMVVVGAAGTLLIASFAAAGGGSHEIRADAGLIGFQENPALSTVAAGSFEAKVANDDESFDWTESYSGLEGTVTQSHIHFGQRGVTGGISIWLCGTAANPGPPGTQTCPQSGTISGTADKDDVVGPTGQGIEAAAFSEILAAIRAGKAYANVHSTKWLGGEIRGQLNDPNGHD